MSRKMKDNEFGENQPCHWNYTRLKFATEINGTTLIPTDIEEISYSPMECVRSDFFQPKTISTKKLPTGLSTFKEGDVLLAKITPCFENGNVAVAKNLLNGYGVGSSELIPFTPKKIVDRFLMYLFRSNRFVETGKSTIRGVGGLRRITMDFIYGYSFYAPEIDEQNRIVAYLDQKCSQIDTLISNQQKQIEKLKTYKQSLITEAVTKGLNSDVEMKDSGVEWIGEIPANAKIIHLRHIVNIETGNMDTQNSTSDGKYPLYVRSPIVERCDTYTFDDNVAILMAGDGAGAGRIFHLVSGKYGCHQRVYRMNEFKYAIPKLIKYYLEVMFPILMEQGSAKSTVDSVRLPMLKSFPVVVMDDECQTEIVSYLDKKCGKIDSLISIKQQKIEKLNEYKKSIIYEYVTGKKEA